MSRGREREDYGPASAGVRNKVSVLVRNIPLNFTAEDLRAKFEKFGELRDVYIPRDYYTQRSRGFGFIEFRDERDADEAIYQMDRTTLDGREINVCLSKEGRKTPREMMIIETKPTGGRSGGDDRRDRRRSRSRSPRRGSRYSRSRSRSPRRDRRYSRSPRGRDSDRGRGRDYDRDREYDRGARDRDYDRDRGRDLDREDRGRDYVRDDRDKEYDREKDRDFDRGGRGGDRDFQRSPRAERDGEQARSPRGASPRGDREDDAPRRELEPPTAAEEEELKVDDSAPANDYY